MRLKNLEEGSLQEGHSNTRHQAQTMLKLEELRDMIMVLDMEDDLKTSALTSLDQVANDITILDEAEVSVDNEGNIAGYLATIDEYVEMLFKSAKGTDNNKLTEIAYRIQNAVDDIRTRELGLKPSLIRAKFNETNVNEDIQDDRKYQSLEELRDKLVDIERHIKRLGIMDSATEIQGKPVTGTADIHDQLATMYKNIEGLQGAVARALKIVPGEQNPDIQKFNKKYTKEASGYEGQDEAHAHQISLDGDWDEDRGISDSDCSEVELALEKVGIKSQCEPDEMRQGGIVVHTMASRGTTLDALSKAGFSINETTKEAIQVREAGSPWTTTGKHPEKMTTDELWTEIAVFDEIQDRGETLSPKDMMRLDSLFAYLDTAEMNEAIKRKADSMMESAMWKAKKQ